MKLFNKKINLGLFSKLFQSKKNRIITLFLGVLILGVGIYFLTSSQIDNFIIQQKIKSCYGNKDPKCYVNLIMDTFNKKGLDKALDLATQIYASDPSFAVDCHDVGHLLGAATYKLFKEGKPFKITAKAAFCSYGFYHGFMEQLASEGDITKARDFCNYVDAQISKETPDATLQCFHGIGHGWVNVHGDTTLLGNDLGIVQNGLNLCEKVAGNDSELSRCATGVFNGVATFYSTGQYDLKIKENDPMWICKKVDTKFQDACYISMNTVLYSVTNGDFAKAVTYLSQIADEKMAEHAMINLALPFSLNEINETDHSKSIAVCRSVRSQLVIPCFQGFAFAFMEHGQPGVEYVKAINFCKNNGLTKVEEDGCLSYIYSYLAQWYPQDKAYSICSVEGVYQDLCKQKVMEGIQGLKK